MASYYYRIVAVLLLYHAPEACSHPLVQEMDDVGDCTQGTCPSVGPYANTNITIDSMYRYVTTDGCPKYDNPNWTNPVNACIHQFTYKLPRNPTYAPTPIPVGEELEQFNNIRYLKENPSPILGAVGVLKSGVVIFGVGSPCGFGSDCPFDNTGAPSNYVDAVESEGHTVDQCGGHPAPGYGQYHVHSGLNFNTSAKRQSCALPHDVPNKHSKFLGWMFDGFGMYGQYSIGGQLPTDLDSCGGHTHKIGGVMTYHYHMLTDYPYTIGCYKGCPEVSNNMELAQRVGHHGC